MRITLIHGTFASDAEWTKINSSLCSALRKVCVDAELQQFVWSGKNGHHARNEARDALIRQIGKWRTKSAHDVHFLVAHSHAGNIALQAAQYLENDQNSRVDGVVVMATPFLSCVPRDIDRVNAITGRTLGVVTALLMVPVSVTLAVGVCVLFRNFVTNDNLEGILGALTVLSGLYFGTTFATMKARGCPKSNIG